MKAKITNPNVSNARTPDNKELVETLNVVGKKDGQLHNFVTARFYMGRSASASVVYCCLWVHGKDCYPSGKGSAGGWGYHKQSAALADAIRSAGIELYCSPYAHPVNGEDMAAWKKQERTQRAHIGGCGEGSMIAALEAIAKAAGARGKLLTIHN